MAELTAKEAFVLGRCLEMARLGDEETAKFILERDWNEGVALAHKVAEEIGIDFDENVDSVLEYLADELELEPNGHQEEESDDDATEQFQAANQEAVAQAGQPEPEEPAKTE